MRPPHFFALRTAIFGMLTFHLAQVAVLAFVCSVVLMTAGNAAAVVFVLTGMVSMVLVVAAGQETARGLNGAR